MSRKINISKTLPKLFWRRNNYFGCAAYFEKLFWKNEIFVKAALWMKQVPQKLFKSFISRLLWRDARELKTPTLGTKINSFLMGHSLPLFSLFSSFQQLTVNMFIIKHGQWLDSNWGPLVSEATTLPTLPQLLPTEVKSLSSHT